MPQNIENIGKKELKTLINKNGGFLPMSVENIEKNFPKQAQDKIVEKYGQERANEIFEKATYIKGISSNGDLNRNGYIIRANAWKTAIEQYLVNPVVLLQHDPKEIIGQTFNAKVTKEGLESEMFIFIDQMDDKNQLRFERGQLKAISTGHITQAIEWENTSTGEILSTEKFLELPWEERMSDNWVMAVTSLEWVEQSLVTIPSNRASFITKKNQKFGYLTNELGQTVTDDIKKELGLEENQAVIEEEEEAEVTEVAGDAAEKKDVNEEVSENVTAENAETPETKVKEKAAETVVAEEAEKNILEDCKKTFWNGITLKYTQLVAKENAVKEKKEVLEIRSDSVENVLEDLTKNGLEKVAEVVSNELTALRNQLSEVETKRNELQKLVSSIPVKRGLTIMGQDGVIKPLEKNEESPDGKTIADVFQNNGITIHYKSDPSRSKF